MAPMPSRFPRSYLPDCTLPRLVNFTTNFVSLPHVEFLERHRNQVRTLSLAVLPPPFRKQIDLEAIGSLPHFQSLKTVTCYAVMVSGIAYPCNASIEEMTIRWNESVIAANVLRQISRTNTRALKLELSLDTWSKSLFRNMVAEIPGLWSLSISLSAQIKHAYTSVNIAGAQSPSTSLVASLRPAFS
ncbi:hypothetical protein B0H17DRAFT_1139484 [Mycena rosella]|uniref:Uncharacterized protein n=1 Tax=Mycena rosella TaxID=1033263 RepID=A0AAD7GCD9_MYCRO|nr:hypothetical protein B0H17DRAFT_1139484 [Mycena rosella]